MATMSSTNYTTVFIRVAADCPIGNAEEPPASGAKPTVAQLQFNMISAEPYLHTSDDVLFAVYAARNGVDDSDSETERAKFFAKPQACLRASPLPKRYGWGIHHNADSKVALVPIGSARYTELANDPTIKQLEAMRSKRA